MLLRKGLGICSVLLQIILVSHSERSLWLCKVQVSLDLNGVSVEGDVLSSSWRVICALSAPWSGERMRMERKIAARLFRSAVYQRRVHSWNRWCAIDAHERHPRSGSDPARNVPIIVISQTFHLNLSLTFYPRPILVFRISLSQQLYLLSSSRLFHWHVHLLLLVLAELTWGTQHHPPTMTTSPLLPLKPTLSSGESSASGMYAPSKQDQHSTNVTEAH